MVTGSVTSAQSFDTLRWTSLQPRLPYQSATSWRCRLTAGMACSGARPDHVRKAFALLPFLGATGFQASL